MLSPSKLTLLLRHGRNRMVVLYLQLPVQSVPISTKIVSLNPIHSEVYSIQHYVIKFVSDLRQVCGVFRVESGIKHHKPNQTLLILSVTS